jgi:hypothetical protein
MNFLDADRLAGKDGAEVYFFVSQTDASAIGDHDDLVVEGIIDVGQTLIGAGGRLIDLDWALHIQSLVRALVIEDFHELIEAGLLLEEVAGGRLGGFFLQGEMHAFVAAILLRMAGLDAFNANAQAEPPDGELAQVKQGMSGSKRNTVIAADVGGQSTVVEKPLKHGKSIVFAGRGESFAAQQISAGVIGDGERVTNAVHPAKPAATSSIGFGPVPPVASSNNW